MEEENTKSQEISFIKEDEEEFRNLPPFIQSMIGNMYNSSSQQSSKSREQTKASNPIIYNYPSLSQQFTGFNSFTNEDTDSNIKIFNIKDTNLSIMKKSLRITSILENNKKEYMENIKECSICFRIIINYGLLSNCDDIFCYECIKQWRNEAKAKNKRDMFRRCPICNRESPLLVKSKFYLVGEEKKQKIIEYKQETNNNNNNNQI